MHLGPFQLCTKVFSCGCETHDPMLHFREFKSYEQEKTRVSREMAGWHVRTNASPCALKRATHYSLAQRVQNRGDRRGCVRGAKVRDLMSVLQRVRSESTAAFLELGVSSLDTFGVDGGAWKIHASRTKARKSIAMRPQSCPIKCHAKHPWR